MKAWPLTSSQMALAALAAGLQHQGSGKSSHRSFRIKPVCDAALKGCAANPTSRDNVLPETFQELCLWHFFNGKASNL
jgi:hypothetical protein